MAEISKMINCKGRVEKRSWATSRPFPVFLGWGGLKETTKKSTLRAANVLVKIRIESPSYRSPK
jgi:hypothetical protein